MLYNSIVARFDEFKAEKIPLSDMAHKYGFKYIEPTDKDEIFRAELIDGENEYIISIKSYDHNRTFEMRPSTYHNYLYHYRNSKLIGQSSYMYEDV